MKTYKSLILAILPFLATTSSHAVFFDDFSSGNLNDWTIDSVAGNTFQIDNGILTLLPSATPAFGTTTYTSGTINWGTVTAANPIRAYVALPANPFLNTANDYDAFRIVISDGTNNATLRVDYRNTVTASASNDWRWRVEASGMTPFDQFIPNYSGIPLSAPRYLALDYDGTTFSIGIYDTDWNIVTTPTPTRVPSWTLGDSGTIAFGYSSGPNTGVGQASVMLDGVGVAVIPESSTYALIFGFLAFLSVLSVRRSRS